MSDQPPDYEPTLTASGSGSTLSTSLHGRFEPGTRLGTRYRIVAFLDRGGMGVVYRADDLELNQPVALKFLPQRLARNPADLARLRQEVRTARQISHPNVCRTYDLAETRGDYFVVMEYVDGEDLASALRRLGRPASEKALEIARQLSLVLRYLLRSSKAAVIGVWVIFFFFLWLGVDTGWKPTLLLIPFVLIFTLVAVFLTMRYGFAAAVSMYLFGQIVGGLPWTSDLSTWFASQTLFSWAIVAVLLVYAFVTSTGGKSFLRDPLGDT